MQCHQTLQIVQGGWCPRAAGDEGPKNGRRTSKTAVCVRPTEREGIKES